MLDSNLRTDVFPRRGRFLSKRQQRAQMITNLTIAAVNALAEREVASSSEQGSKPRPSKMGALWLFWIQTKRVGTPPTSYTTTLSLGEFHRPFLSTKLLFFLCLSLAFGYIKKLAPLKSSLRFLRVMCQSRNQNRENANTPGGARSSS